MWVCTNCGEKFPNIQTASKHAMDAKATAKTKKDQHFVKQEHVE